MIRKRTHLGALKSPVLRIITTGNPNADQRDVEGAYWPQGGYWDCIMKGYVQVPADALYVARMNNDCSVTVLKPLSQMLNPLHTFAGWPIPEFHPTEPAPWIGVLTPEFISGTAAYIFTLTVDGDYFDESSEIWIAGTNYGQDALWGSMTVEVNLSPSWLPIGDLEVFVQNGDGQRSNKVILTHTK